MIAVLAAILAVSWLGWASTVVVPVLLICIPLLWAHINSKLNRLDTRNSDQHETASLVRTERFEALEARLDEVLKITTDTNMAVHDTNNKIDNHLRDHLRGVA